ncbi:MAG TPA: inovirus Gp2 family protein [Alcaligenaceae bacterium]|nr:inovirus Gp2 family protein [Alcaligenaceae bacterium]
MTREKDQHSSYYNNIIHEVINQALETHTRTTVIRVDLRFPQDVINVEDDSKVITRFFSSLRAKILNDLRRKNKDWGRNHRCSVNYVWVREYGDRSNRKHYHVLIFLNKDVYHSLGDFNESEGNLAALIKQAWNSANGLDSHILAAPVYFHNKVFYMDGNSEHLLDQVREVTEHASYLTKLITKRFGDGNRSIGRSAISRRGQGALASIRLLKEASEEALGGDKTRSGRQSQYKPRNRVLVPPRRRFV